MHGSIANASLHHPDPPVRGYADGHKLCEMALRGDRVKALREQLRLSQVELSTRAGITQSTLSRIEQGRSHGSYAATVREFARALGCTQAYLEGAEEPELRTDPAPEHAPVTAARPEAVDVLSPLTTTCMSPRRMVRPSRSRFAKRAPQALQRQSVAVVDWVFMGCLLATHRSSAGTRAASLERGRWKPGQDRAPVPGSLSPVPQPVAPKRRFSAPARVQQPTSIPTTCESRLACKQVSAYSPRNGRASAHIALARLSLVIVRPSRDPGVLKLRVLHEVAHILLTRLGWSHSHGDVWALTLALAAPRSSVGPGIAGLDLAAGATIPAWAAWLRLEMLAS